MKKFISMVMAAAMVATLVPATAFAKGDVSATAKVVDALDEDKDFDGKVDGVDDEVPELQLKITNADYTKTTNGEEPEMDVTVTLDNADFDTKKDAKGLVGIRLDDPVGDQNGNQNIKDLKQAMETAKQEYENAKNNAGAGVSKDALDAAKTAAAALEKIDAKAKAAVTTAKGHWNRSRKQKLLQKMHTMHL